MTNDNEPTWGAGLPGASPSEPTIPNQRSMPVTGSGSSRPTTPHSDYHQQAAQRYGSQSVPQQPPVMPYPAAYPVVSPTGYPVVPPMALPAVPTAPLVGGGQPHPVYPPVARDSFIIRLMEKGVQGGLFRQPWFHDMRQRNANAFVYISFVVGFVASIALSLIPSSFVVTVFTTFLWVAIGYLYLALGTKLGHQFLLFGICLVGGLVMAFRVLSAIVGLAGSGYYYEDPAVLMVVLLVNLVGVAAAVYVGIQVHRGIQRMSQP